MIFTKEAWEAAPEGSALEMNICIKGKGQWIPVHFVGLDKNGRPVIADSSDNIWRPRADMLRIAISKRKVTVQLWQREEDGILRAFINWQPQNGWKCLGEHTFEIEGE